MQSQLNIYAFTNPYVDPHVYLKWIFYYYSKQKPFNPYDSEFKQLFPKCIGNVFIVQYHKWVLNENTLQ